ncbi:MAG: hypothetical protein K2L55_06820 [Muribaculaceae bacterium]|nr:hypothetical protein [Muribaculaceae bacterium]MDE6346363.1 hypothetical protein [Muribaculaceae bacterium]
MAGSKIGQKIALLLTIVICLGGIADAQTPLISNSAKVANKLKTKPQVGFKVTEVINKVDDGIVRICGNLSGRPHTSLRIDSISIIPDVIPVKAVDIDGVDFERYFQWEDDGTIYIEIDFPMFEFTGSAKYVLEGNTVVFHTVKGDIPVFLTELKEDELDE